MLYCFQPTHKLKEDAKTNSWLFTIGETSEENFHNPKKIRVEEHKCKLDHNIAEAATKGSPS